MPIAAPPRRARRRAARADAIFRITALVFAGLLACGGPVWAQEQTAESDPAAEAAAPNEPTSALKDWSETPRLETWSTFLSDLERQLGRQTPDAETLNAYRERLDEQIAEARGLIDRLRDERQAAVDERARIGDPPVDPVASVAENPELRAARARAEERISLVEARLGAAERALARLSEALERIESDELFRLWDATATEAEQELDDPAPDPERLAELRRALEAQRSDARALAGRVAEQTAPLRAKAQVLREAATDPDATLDAQAVNELEALSARLSRLENRGSLAESAAERARVLAAQLGDRQRAIFSEQLLRAGPSPLDWRVWAVAAREAGRLSNAFGAAVVAVATARPGAFAVLATLLAAGLAVLWARRREGVVGPVVDKLIRAARTAPSPVLQIAFGSALFLARVAPIAAAAGALAWAGLVFLDPPGVVGRLILVRAAEAVAYTAIAVAIARIIFAPKAPQLRIIDLGDARSVRAAREIGWLTGVISAHRLLVDAGAAAGAAPELLVVVTTFVTIGLAPMLIDLARVVFRAQRDPQAPSGDGGGDDEEEQEGFDAASVVGVVRNLLILVAIALPVTAALGYFALSVFLLHRLALSLSLLSALALVFVIVRRVSGGGGGGGGEGTEEARRRLGVMSAVTGLCLALIAAPILAYIWGASADDLRAIFQRLIDGVEIGGATYSLTGALFALGVFIIGLWLTRFLQRLLRRDVLPATRIDRGLQTSLTAGLGYVGFFVTVIIAVSAAGVDLSRLALIAGALSVGIGFGLQNVVNNFVSGLILLVERPVKVGDWIVVGEAQGYVRRINVRSTEIETFDRASVIVPNSELISNQVVNWTHKNMTGRVIVKVGVSYDADPDQVAELLKEAAAGHPMVLRYPAPVVLLRGFGASSLDFELRAFLRDVNWVLSVESDLNLAVLKRLRAEGIEIPFPQRDLNLRGPWPPTAADAAHPEDAPPAPQAAETT